LIDHAPRAAGETVTGSAAVLEMDMESFGLDPCGFVSDL